MSIKAYAIIKLTGYNIRRFINLCTVNHLRIWNIRYISSTEYEACCLTNDIFAMKPHLKKTHTKLLVTKRKGIFTLFAFIHRIRIVATSAACFLGILILLDMHVWKIDVSGNRFISDITVTDYVNSCGIYDGCHKVSDYRWLEHDLEENFSDIMWCSIYLEDCTLKIDICDGINYRLF